MHSPAKPKQLWTWSKFVQTFPTAAVKGNFQRFTTALGQILSPCIFRSRGFGGCTMSKWGKPLKVWFLRLGRVQGPHPGILIWHKNTFTVRSYMFILVGVAFTGTVLKVKGCASHRSDEVLHNEVSPQWKLKELWVWHGA